MLSEQTWGIISTIFQKITAFASILGSSMIISQVMRIKKNRESTTQRLICFASIFDLLASITWLLTNFMMPEHEDNPDKFYIGWDWSCQVQGFFLQLSLAGIMCNSVFISLNHLLRIKHNWQDFKIRKIEPWYYFFSLLLGLTTAIIAVSTDRIGPAQWNCFINEPEYQMLLFYIWLWSFIIISAVFSVLLYLHVAKIEEAGSKFRSHRKKGGKGTGKSHADTCKYSRAVYIQSVLYVGGFVMTWIFPTIYRVVGLVSEISGDEIKHDITWLASLAEIFAPSQGVFNALVFFRVRAMKCRSENPGKMWITVICSLVASTLLCTNSSVSNSDSSVSNSDSKDLIKEPKEFEKSVRSLREIAIKIASLREGEELEEEFMQAEEEGGGKEAALDQISVGYVT